MKKFTVLVFFLFAVSLVSQPQYYTSNTGTSANNFPFGMSAGKSVNTIFLAGEINQPTPVPTGQQITKVYFRTGGAGTRTFTNLHILLAQDVITTLTTGVFYPGPMDTVFNKASISLTSTVGGWMEIVLDTPYPYDPTKSLIMFVGQCGFTGTGTTVYNSTGLSGIRRVWSVGGCPFLPYAGGDASLVNFGVDVVPAVSCNYQWNVQTSGTTNILQSVKAVNDLVGWAAGGAATVRKTTDGGQTWTNGNPNPGVINGDIYNIEAIDADNAWVTTSPAATYIYRTTNGGTNWAQVHTVTGGFINAIWMVNANTGYATGDPVAAVWELLMTTNGGLNWAQMPSAPAQVGSEAGWNNSFFISGNDIWFGTNNTKVYHSTNLGLNWTSGPTTGTVNTYAVHFNTATNGLGGGSTTAFIVRTTDAGTTYSTVASIPTGTGNITGLEGTGSNYWALRGNHVFRSSNNGDNWTQDYTGTTALWDIDFAVVGNCPQGWAVGATGTIVRMINITGVPGVNNQLPSSYSLMQNYPNPFNPATKISFSLPKAGSVKLVVFDILGREVATVVNDYRPAGSYSIDFDASNLSSGVYFYTLNSGSFTDTKKMVLMK